MATQTRGRPTKLTPEVHDNLLRLFRLGMQAQQSCDIVGIHVSTFNKWRQRVDYLEAEDIKPSKADAPFVAFFADLTRAKAEGEAALLAGIQQIARGQSVVKERVLKDGSVERQYERPDWRGLAWTLERVYPERYRERRELTVDQVERTDIDAIVADPEVVDLLLRAEEKMAGLGTNEDGA